MFAFGSCVAAWLLRGRAKLDVQIERYVLSSSALSRRGMLTHVVVLSYDPIFKQGSPSSSSASSMPTNAFPIQCTALVVQSTNIPTTCCPMAPSSSRLHVPSPSISPFPTIPVTPHLPALYQLAFFTPGSMPARALTLKLYCTPISPVRCYPTPPILPPPLANPTHAQPSSPEQFNIPWTF